MTRLVSASRYLFARDDFEMRLRFAEHLAPDGDCGFDGTGVHGALDEPAHVGVVAIQNDLAQAMALGLVCFAGADGEWAA